jgi:predicted ATP-dependent endonuclease of OLD family
MRINQVKIKSFKRFNELTIQNIPATARLIILAGPNGCGKSSLFDAFLVQHKRLLSQFFGFGLESDYHQKIGLQPVDLNNIVNVSFHEPTPTTENELRSLFYFRTAYRNEADFIVNNFQRVDKNTEQNRLNKLIQNDLSVASNYQRLIAETIAAMYSGTHDEKTVRNLREELIGKVRESMLRVFQNLVLEGVGRPLEKGTFLFTKGESKDFPYKNLSGGEKAAFDLILDFVVKIIAFNNTVFCIDEPELHMNTRLQSKLLDELFTLLPDRCQLWIATHSIGMMRRARDLQETNSNEVAFLDFEDKDFDQPQILEPCGVNRTFWERTLKVALDDLADLVAPQKVVICEGKPLGQTNSKNVEFDARCYRTVFSKDFPDVQFLSAGNSNAVEEDKLALIEAIKALAKGIQIIRVIDRDDRTISEINDLALKGVRVLSRRNIESYLFDDEILKILCNEVGKPEQAPILIEEKQKAITRSIERGNPIDDIKSAGGDISNAAKRLLNLTNPGNTTDAFCRDTLAPLISKHIPTYEQLKLDIFGC